MLGFFANEHVKTLHVRREGRVGLPFLLPDETSSGDHYPCPWNNACTVEHDLVIGRASRVGNCFFPAYRPNEESLLVRIKVQGAQQLCNGPSCSVLLVGNAKAQVCGDCEPGE